MKFIINYLTLLLFAVVLFAFEKMSAQTPNIIVGDIPVSYDVSPTGAFQYTVPLRIPPGIKDMVPNLAITYNSQGGDGHLGQGWSLAGLSAITRSTPTIHHDLTLDPVDFDASDVFLLDGQRMFWESATSSYLTEVKNFAIIKSFGTAGSGPSYFTVEYPDGTVAEYGNSTSSKMVAQGKSDVFMWGVNKITDVHGNYITFDYINVSSTGEFGISQIQYGHNSVTGNGIPVTIEFNYHTSQVDMNKAWVHGSEVLGFKLLSDITIKFSTLAQANKYAFTYDQNGVHARLTKIEELRDGNNVMEPINITWGTSSTQNGLEVSTSIGSTGAVHEFTSGDYNGDGATDVLKMLYSSSGPTPMSLHLSGLQDNFTTKSSDDLPYGTAPSFIRRKSKPTTAGKMQFDYDGDGDDDIVMACRNYHLTTHPRMDFLLFKYDHTQQKMIYEGYIMRFDQQNPGGGLDWLDHATVTPGDYDGDGKTEILFGYPDMNSSGVISYDYYLIGDEYPTTALNNSPYYDKVPTPQVGFCLNAASQHFSMDMDGDGKDEFVRTVLNASHELHIFGFNFNYTPSPVIGSTPMYLHHLDNWFEYDNSFFSGDFNGDGKQDILVWEPGSTNPGPQTGTWDIAFSKGGSFDISGLPSSLSLSAYGTSDGDHVGQYVADFNGDGKDDILELYDNGQRGFNIYYATGYNQFKHESGSLPNIDIRSEKITVGDFNGDGQADLLCHRNNTSTPYIYYFHKNEDRHLVTSIEHTGNTINAEYESLPQGANYVKIQPTGSDFLARAIPMKVAKRIHNLPAIDNNYTYQGLICQKYGVGMKGMKKFTVENVTGQKTYQTFELETAIPYLKEETALNALGSLPYGMFTTYQQFDFPGGASGKSHIIINSPLKVTDNTGGSATITTITTGSTSPGTVFYNFGKVESVSQRTKDLLGGLNGLQTTTYNYGSNWATLKGKPESVTVYSDIDPAGANSITRSTEYAYYSNGDLQTVKTDPGTPNEKVKDYSYDAYGNVTQTDLNAAGVAGGPITNIYTYTTDGKFLASEVNPMGYTTTYNHGSLVASWGNVLSKTSHKGLQTQYTYDAVNRVTMAKDVLSGIESYTYYEWPAASNYSAYLPGAHMLVRTSNSYDATANATVYDVYGRKLRDVTFGGIYVDYTYGTTGQVETVMGPYDSFAPIINTATTTYTYDDWGRETERSTDNGGPTIQTDYAVNNGLLHTTVTNLGANTWKTSVTCGKTLRSVINSGTPNHSIDYTYHGNGTVATTVVNNGSGGGKTFTNTVDAYGRVTDNTQPNAGTINYSYDALDRVVTETRANGTVYQYDYDLLGRVWQKHMSGSSQPYTYTYENTNGWGSTGKLIQETSPNGHVKDYTYGTEGWLHSITEDNIYETIYAYYPNGNLWRYTFDNDITIEYTYYQSGIPQEATLISGSQFSLPLGNQKLWWGWWVNPHGQRHGAYFFNTANSQAYTERYTYDVHGLLEKHEMINNAVATIADNRYSFDLHTGNLAWRRDDLRNHTEYFTYDNHYDRLETVSQSLWGGPATQALGMAYDEHGNIKEKDDVAPVLTHPWKYDDYALETVEMPHAPPFPPTVAIPHFRQDITYTPFEKVERMREDQNNEVFFTYGADDQRVQATYTDLTGGAAGSLQKTKTYYNNYERIDYITGAKDELFYVWAGEELVAILKVFTQPGQATVSNIYYPMRDHLGSITHLMDINWAGGAAGNGVAEERSFDAWGRTRDPNNWMPYPIGGHPGFWITDRGYTGHEHIWMPTFSNMYDNNIINMNGRLYDPLVGRMFSPDPFIGDIHNSQAYNKYSYVMNNPLKYTDPTGNLFVGVGTTLVNELFRTMFTRGGLEFWNGNTTGNAWREFRNSFNEGGKVNNAHRIDMGVFAWTDNKTVAGNLLAIGSRLMGWEHQQTEWGKTFAHVRNNLGMVDNVDYYEGATVVNRDGGLGRWGATVGTYIHSQNMGEINNHNPLLRHEYGHTIESRIFGPLYMSQVGIPSLKGAIINGRRGHDHDTEWYETQANRLSHRYHGSGMRRQVGLLDPQRGGAEWDRSYPLEYNPNWFWLFYHPINPFWFGF